MASCLAAREASLAVTSAFHLLRVSSRARTCSASLQASSCMHTAVAGASREERVEGDAFNQQAAYRLHAAPYAYEEEGLWVLRKGS